MTKKFILPEELKEVRLKALKAIDKIRPVDDNTRADKDFIFKAQETEASKKLPEYYLVYFLFVELLGFKNLGQFEKVAWSVPIDYEGEAFLIEHRKFGVGVFAHNASVQKEQAEQIVKLINRGIKAAAPFFNWLASNALLGSKLNVVNNSGYLFKRFQYFLKQYKKVESTAVKKAHERSVKVRKLKNGGIWTSYKYPSIELREKAAWLALASIDAFFSWTEHVFIHIAIISGKITTGIEVSNLAESDWQTKFKKALDVNDKKTKYFFDKLVAARRQMRSFLAHGAFGKGGEAFHFHSRAGAIPVIMCKNHPSFIREEIIDEKEAIEVIEKFISYLWSGNLEPAKLYIQDSNFPIILSYAKDGRYKKAMISIKGMEFFMRELGHEIDRSANMDW